MNSITRRDFMKGMLVGGVAAGSAGILAACSSSSSSASSSSSSSSSSESDSSASTSSSSSDSSSSSETTTVITDPKSTGMSDIFPLEEPITLTYWIKANSAMTATMETYADVAFFQELEEQTNVHIEWNHNTSDEAFSLMIAGGELPDMINWNLGNAAGGVAALLEDNVIVDLTDLMPEYAPNYYMWLMAMDEFNRENMTDEGQYYMFVNFNADWDNMERITFKILGPQIRKDWLDQLGMEIPTTVDELYDVLVAFKENDMDGDGDPDNEIPWVISSNMKDMMWTLAGSFGTRNDFQMLDGEIIYGPTSDNMKTFLEFMNKCYTEGLINSDFAVNSDAFNSVLTGEAGFAFNSMGSGLIATHELLKENDENANWVSVPWLVGPDGHQSFTQDSGSNPRATAVTTACEYPEIALAWLDYAYSYAGSIASTYGIEGVSYEWVDGLPTIKDEVKQNDNGWTEEESMSRYMLGSINYPNARDKYFYEQINLNEDYKVQIQTDWNLQTDEILIPALILTSEESSTYSSVMSDIETYTSECLLKFIIGDMSLENDWDTYVSNVEGMGIDTALQIERDAYDRYLGR